MLSKRHVFSFVLSLVMISAVLLTVGIDSSAETVIVDDYEYGVTILTEPDETGYGTLRIISTTYAGTDDLTIPSELTIDSKTYRVKEIGDGVFSHKSMKTLTIPYSVKVIGADAFSNCIKLTKVTIDSSLDTLGDRAFSHCYSVTEMHFRSTPVNLGAESLSLGVVAKQVKCDLYGFKPTRPVVDDKNPYADVFGPYTTVTYKDITPDSKDSIIHIALISLGVFALLFMCRSVKVKKIKRPKNKKYPKVPAERRSQGVPQNSKKKGKKGKR